MVTAETNQERAVIGNASGVVPSTESSSCDLERSSVDGCATSVGVVAGERERCGAIMGQGSLPANKSTEGLVKCPRVKQCTIVGYAPGIVAATEAGSAGEFDRACNNDEILVR